MNGKTKAPKKRTAAETILLAALSFEGRDFTKWELAVAAWKIDPERFGLRGFKQQHPDSNRVIVEIVGFKPSSPVQRGLMESPGPSLFRLTPTGRAEAEALRGAVVRDDTSDRLYMHLRGYLEREAFIRWMADPAQPSDITDAIQFLSPGGLGKARELILTARGWMRTKSVPCITCYRSSAHGGPNSRNNWPEPVTMADLANLDDFLTALEYRFPQLRKDSDERTEKGPAAARSADASPALSVDGTAGGARNARRKTVAV